MKYILKYETLQLGDIILDREDSEESRRIRKATGADYSHARIYVGGTIMEANGMGVQSVNPQRIVYDDLEDVIVLRCTKIDLVQIINVCMYARSEFGKEYNITKKENTYCFRLVAESYQYAGIEIVVNPKRCSAKDFLSSEKLVKVPDMLRDANEHDLMIAISEGIMHDKGHYNQQTEAAGDMFNKIRQFVEKQGSDADIIQNDSKLIDFLINNPQFDEGIAEILESSPYFDLWQVYIKQNPWEFDAVSFRKECGKHAHDIAWQVIESCNNMEPIWNYNCSVFFENYKRFHFKSFKVYVELYNNLLLMNEKRRKTAETVLGYDELDV